MERRWRKNRIDKQLICPLHYRQSLHEGEVEWGGWVTIIERWQRLSNRDIQAEC
jgi:hypothetical protein